MYWIYYQEKLEKKKEGNSVKFILHKNLIAINLCKNKELYLSWMWKIDRSNLKKAEVSSVDRW